MGWEGGIGGGMQRLRAEGGGAAGHRSFIGAEEITIKVRLLGATTEAQRADYMCMRRVGFWVVAVRSSSSF